jgi:hypothetical protein
MADIADLKNKILPLQKANTEISNAITRYTASYDDVRGLDVEDHHDLFDSIDGEIEKLNIVKEILHSINTDVDLQRTIAETNANLVQLESDLADVTASTASQQVFDIPTPSPSPRLSFAVATAATAAATAATAAAATTLPKQPHPFNLSTFVQPPVSPSSAVGAATFANITKYVQDKKALYATQPARPSPPVSSSQVTLEITPGTGHAHILLPSQVPLNQQQHLTSIPRWYGGSKIKQIGGKSEYELPITKYELTPGSDLFVRAVTGLHPISSPEFRKENPDFDKQVTAGFIDGSIEPVPKTENEDASSQETSDDLSPAAQSADNPEIIKNLIMNLKVNPVIKASIINKYEELVMMCQRKTALELIKPLLKPEKDEIVPSDREILTTLGWNGSENELLYDKNVSVNDGLFSFFCFDKGKIASAFSDHCGKNYACMLNWVLIAAFRLRIRDPAKYTDAAIIKLIKNMHDSLYGFLVSGSIADNFTRRTDGNADFYIEGAKKAMKDGIFYDVTLGGLVGAIKVEVGKIPEPKDTLSTYFPRKSPSQTTVKSGGIGGSGGGHKSIKLTRKRHHHKIHKIAHTIKVTKNPTTNTKKTRRHVSHVKT